MTEEQRREATIAVLTWLEESCGKDIAETWAWSFTPMPCALPVDDQLEEGMSWALAGREAAKVMMEASRKASDEALEYQLSLREAMGLSRWPGG